MIYWLAVAFSATFASTAVAAEEPGLPLPSGWMEKGALGIVGFIVFASAIVVWNFFPKIIDAINGIGTALASQMDKQDARHREERDALRTIITDKLDKVVASIDRLRDDLPGGPKH
jgi:hypothetical protein